MTVPVETDVEEQSSYLQYLPAFYREDDFTGRFLHVFEDIFKSIEGIIDVIPFYFDPGTTPDSFLPWLASWLGLVLDERWPEIKRRQLVRSAVDLYRWRGTKRGLSEYLKLYTGVTPTITEHGAAEGMRLGGTSKLGTPMQIGGKGGVFCFTVELKLPDKSDVDTDVVRSIIEIQKPAHTAYLLNIIQKNSGKSEA
jgi:phage tail-like protein